MLYLLKHPNTFILFISFGKCSPKAPCTLIYSNIWFLNFSCEGLVQNWIKNQIEKLKTENRKRKRKRNKKKKENQLTWAKTCAETGPSGEPSHLHAVQQPNRTSPADVWDRGTHLSASSSRDINGADGYCRRGNSSFTPPPLRPRAPRFSHPPRLALLVHLPHFSPSTAPSLSRDSSPEIVVTAAVRSSPPARGAVRHWPEVWRMEKWFHQR